MHRSFKFQVQYCQNGTWIGTAKFGLKIQIRSEDNEKMQTEFPQCGIFP